MDSKYCQYLYKNQNTISSRDRTNAHIHVQWIEINENVWLDREFKRGTLCIASNISTTELSRPINIHGPSRPNYRIPPLPNFCPLRNTEHTHVPVRTYWFNKCLIKDGHITKCNRKERKYRNKQFLHWKGKMCERMKNTEMILKK